MYKKPNFFFTISKASTTDNLNNFQFEPNISYVILKKEQVLHKKILLNKINK